MSATLSHWHTYVRCGVFAEEKGGTVVRFRSSGLTGATINTCILLHNAFYVFEFFFSCLGGAAAYFRYYCTVHQLGQAFIYTIHVYKCCEPCGSIGGKCGISRVTARSSVAYRLRPNASTLMYTRITLLIVELIYYPFCFLFIFFCLTQEELGVCFSRSFSKAGC